MPIGSVVGQKQEEGFARRGIVGLNVFHRFVGEIVDRVLRHHNLASVVRNPIVVERQRVADVERYQC
jgi:hypothetical protein